MSGDRCKHQDLVSFWSGNRLLVERNSFGVYRYGAAQLYLIRGVDRVSIVNNLFRGTDPKVAGYQARVAIIVGSKGSKRVPRGVRIVNNTILTGDTPHRRLRGLDPDERRVLAPPAYRRPLLANNVIGLLEDPHHVCSVAARPSRTSCSTELRAEARIVSARRTWTPSGAQPARQPCSSIARADGFSARRDIDGRSRDARPDIGAYEYRSVPRG